MSHRELSEAYHAERAVAAREGIPRYPCACVNCHGLKIQAVDVVATHHRIYGRDTTLTYPVLRAGVGDSDDSLSDSPPTDGRGSHDNFNDWEHNQNNFNN